MVSDDRGALGKCPVAAITGHNLRTGRKVATSSGGAAASKWVCAFRGCFEVGMCSRGRSRKVHLNSPETRTKKGCVPVHAGAAARWRPLGIVVGRPGVRSTGAR